MREREREREKDNEREKERKREQENARERETIGKEVKKEKEQRERRKAAATGRINKVRKLKTGTRFGAEYVLSLEKESVGQPRVRLRDALEVGDVWEKKRRRKS